eukprot:1786257-Pyramimonas_sp.AAC.1
MTPEGPRGLGPRAKGQARAKGQKGLGQGPWGPWAKGPRGFWGPQSTPFAFSAWRPLGGPTY